MRYILRPGIVRTQICGAYLLIPDRMASEVCPHIQRLSIIMASAVEFIDKGEPYEKAYKISEILQKKSEEEAKDYIDTMCADLCEKGFLIRVEDDKL